MTTNAPRNNAAAAPVGRNTRLARADIERQIADVREEKEMAELSNDRAYTDGTIDGLNKRLADLQNRLASLS